MSTADVIKLKDKFFTDPDWRLMEDLIREYIDPLTDSMNIDITLTNDQIATEVRGRQLAYKSLNDFLEQSQVLRPRIISNTTSFK